MLYNRGCKWVRVSSWVLSSAQLCHTTAHNAKLSCIYLKGIYIYLYIYRYTDIYLYIVSGLGLSLWGVNRKRDIFFFIPNTPISINLCVLADTHRSVSQHGYGIISQKIFSIKMDSV